MRANLFVLVIALIAGPAFADAQRYDGQATDGAYAIEMSDQLLALAEKSQNFSFSNSTFTLTADIDLSGKDWTPLGNDSTPFSGKFYGNGHEIRNMVCTNSPLSPCRGLFGKTSGASLDGITVSALDWGGQLRKRPGGIQC